jgi:hypothetical protein
MSRELMAIERGSRGAAGAMRPTERQPNGLLNSSTAQIRNLDTRKAYARAAGDLPPGR